MRLTNAYVFTTEAGLDLREGTITLKHRDLSATLLVTVSEKPDGTYDISVGGFTRCSVGDNRFTNSSPYTENSRDALEVIEFVNACVDKLLDDSDLQDEVYRAFFDEKLNNMDEEISNLRNISESVRLIMEYCNENGIQDEHTPATSGSIAVYISELRCRNTKDYAL